MRILLVDDEIELVEPLRHMLMQEDYDVDVAYEGKTGLDLAKNREYDLLILDWMLPYYSGLEICKAIRLDEKSTPVLFLTAKDTLDNRVEGLDAGADDYLVKPFELRELLARVRALLRRSPVLSNTKITDVAIDLEIDIENQLAYRRGKAIHLSEKEMALLAFFMQNPGRLLVHREIYQHLWPDSSPDNPNSNVLAALVRLLRRKVELKNEQPIIHSVYGKGYRFEQIN